MLGGDGIDRGDKGTLRPLRLPVFEAISFVQPTLNFHERERKGSMVTLQMRNRCGKLPIFGKAMKTISAAPRLCHSAVVHSAPLPRESTRGDVHRSEIRKLLLMGRRKVDAPMPNPHRSNPC
jgi:hypothetical protein